MPGIRDEAISSSSVVTMVCASIVLCFKVVLLFKIVLFFGGCDVYDGGVAVAASS